MNKITPYIIVFITGIILGSVIHQLHFFCKSTDIIVHDTIPIMNEPKIIIDSFPYPVFVSNKSEIPNNLPLYYTDTIIDSTLCCIDYIKCLTDYNKLYNYTDTVLRIRGYSHIIEDSLIKITVRDTTVGKLIYADLTYFIKPLILSRKQDQSQSQSQSQSSYSLFANFGYDLSTKRILGGIDYNKNKIIIGYLGNLNNQNSIKIGFKIR